MGEGLTIEQILDRLGLTGLADTARAIEQRLPVTVPGDWRRLAAALAAGYLDGSPGPLEVLGISGGQGAGKSTLAGALVAALEQGGVRAASLSLDDFYLTRAERDRLAGRVHPLLATRGVPGTHDVALAGAVIDALRAGREVASPVFDKAADDRLTDAEARRIGPGVSVLIFEGWCLGATPQPAAALTAPVNDLERTADPDAVWRGYVNDCLAGAYAGLWQRLDRLLFLAVPDIDAVVRWRTEQERQHEPRKRMGTAAVARFVAHYERLTRWMLATLPETADIVGFLDEKHALADLRVRRF
jgi:D-glycerate 3-kinase